MVYLVISHFLSVKLFRSHGYDIVYVALPLAFLKHETRLDLVCDAHFFDNRLTRLIMSFTNLLNSIHMTSCFDGYGVCF